LEKVATPLTAETAVVPLSVEPVGPVPALICTLTVPVKSVNMASDPTSIRLAAVLKVDPAGVLAGGCVVTLKLV
jgi:hypothetical protein